MPKSIAKHTVVLTPDQRAELERITRQTSVGVAETRWATLLPLADDAHPDGGRTDDRIAADVGLSVRQIERVRNRTTARGPSRRWRGYSTFTTPPTTPGTR